MPAVNAAIIAADGRNICDPALEPPLEPIAYAKAIGVEFASAQRFNRCQYNIAVKATCKIAMSASEIRSAFQMSLHAMTDGELATKTSTPQENVAQERSVRDDAIERDYPDGSVNIGSEAERFAHFKFVAVRAGGS